MSTGTDLAQRLRGVITEVYPLLEALGAERASAVRAEGKWSAQEIIGHLVDSAANNHRRFVLAQGRDDLLFEGYDQEHWVRSQRYKSEPWLQVLSLWHSYNCHLAWVIEGIREDELQRPRLIHSLDRIASAAQRSEDPVTLAFLIKDYIDHLENHLSQIFPERRH